MLLHVNTALDSVFLTDKRKNGSLRSQRKPSLKSVGMDAEIRELAKSICTSTATVRAAGRNLLEGTACLPLGKKVT